MTGFDYLVVGGGTAGCIVAAVELAGVQELAQAYLRAVDVGGEVDLPPGK